MTIRDVEFFLKGILQEAKDRHESYIDDALYDVAFMERKKIDLINGILEFIDNGKKERKDKHREV